MFKKQKNRSYLNFKGKSIRLDDYRTHYSYKNTDAQNLLIKIKDSILKKRRINEKRSDKR